MLMSPDLSACSPCARGKRFPNSIPCATEGGADRLLHSSDNIRPKILLFFLFHNVAQCLHLFLLSFSVLCLWLQGRNEIFSLLFLLPCLLCLHFLSASILMCEIGFRNSPCSLTNGGIRNYSAAIPQFSRWQIQIPLKRYIVSNQIQ